QPPLLQVHAAASVGGDRRGTEAGGGGDSSIAAGGHGVNARSEHPFGASEGLALEFKRATDALPASFFETVCAFLNRGGGLIVLGVEDDGTVSGVEPAAVPRIKTDIANLSNNPQKLDP